MGGMGCAIFFGFCIKWNLNFNEDPPMFRVARAAIYGHQSSRRNGFPETETHHHQVQVVFRRARTPGCVVTGGNPRVPSPATISRCIISWVPLHTNMAWRPMENVREDLGRGGFSKVFLKFRIKRFQELGWYDRTHIQNIYIYTVYIYLFIY